MQAMTKIFNIVFISILCVTNVFPQENTVLDSLSDFSPPVPETDFTSGENLQGSEINNVFNNVQIQNNSLQDIVLLVDNSQSMNLFDPGFQARQILASYVSRQGINNNTSVLLFDEDVIIVVPLVQLKDASQKTSIDDFDSLNYEGGPNNIVRAMERAIYELKYNGINDSDKKIILLTDGFNSEVVNDENSLGLVTESVLSDISELNIQISVIVFSSGSELVGIQSLSQQISIDIKTITDISELPAILNNTDLILPIEEITEDIRLGSISSTASVEQQAPTIAQQPVNTVIRTTATNKEEKTRSVIIIVAAIILIFTLGTLIVMLYLRSRDLRKGKNLSFREAYLIDIHGYTANKRYKLGDKATMLGRVAGKDTNNIDYMVIPESTIGRCHSVIEYKDYAYWIMDQGSINGTFVNNIPISSEIRLKHGDIVRLHKYEFEFSIPELDEAGMTKISNTLMAGHVAESVDVKIEIDNEEEPEVNEVVINLAEEGAELDFDFSEVNPDVEEDNGPKFDEDETLIPGHDLDSTIDDKIEDETLIPDFSPQPFESDIDIFESESANEEAEQENAEIAYPDATLIPGFENDVEEDATIRPNPDNLTDDIFDITGSDEKEK